MSIFMVGKNQSFELDLNQKQPGASLFQFQQLQGKGENRKDFSPQCFMESKQTLGKKGGKVGGGDQEGRPCMYMAAMLHPVYMVLLRHFFFFLVKFEL